MSSEINFILIITFSVLLFLLMKKTRRAKLLPPGPTKLPIIGNLHQMGKLPHRTLQNLSKKHGDLMFLQLGSIPTLIVSSANRAREIFKFHDLVLSARPAIYAAKRFSYNLSSVTFSPYGEYWREIRKVVVLELMTAKRVQSFGYIRVQEVATMIDRIASACPNPVDLSSLAFTLSNSVVRRVAFGKVINSFDQEILHETQHLAGEFNIADYFPGLAWINRFNGVDGRLNKNFQDLDRFLDKIIQEHLDPMRPESEAEDIIDVLLAIRKDPSRTISLKNEQLKAVLLDVLAAGTDTSSTTILWTMAELMRNPGVKEKAQREVREVVKGKSRVEETDLANLTYLKHVIKESLRLHPPAPLLVPRETREDCIIDKYKIPAKTRVFFNAAAISTDPTYWENPERFWPDRFINSQVDFRGQHFELLPFGTGRRGCPGINFSIPLVELALANLLFQFDWKLPEGVLDEDLDMEEEPGITMRKKVPLLLVASPMN